MGFKSSRWMFSISAMAMAASSATARITQGTLSRPANWLARQRRSPAIISYAFLPTGRTTMGCMMPWALMELAKSSSAWGSISRRGWYRPRCKNSIGRCFSSPSTSSFSTTKGLLVSVDTSFCGMLALDNSASSPRPNPFFLAAMSVFLILMCEVWNVPHYKGDYCGRNHAGTDSADRADICSARRINSPASAR